MASKKDLKKQVKRMVNDILDECDYVMINNGTGADKAEKLIDEAVAFYHDVVPKIVASDDPKAFREIRETVQKAKSEFDHKMNAIQS